LDVRQHVVAVATERFATAVDGRCNVCHGIAAPSSLELCEQPTQAGLRCLAATCCDGFSLARNDPELLQQRAGLVGLLGSTKVLESQVLLEIEPGHFGVRPATEVVEHVLV